MHFIVSGDNAGEDQREVYQTGDACLQNMGRAAYYQIRAARQRESGENVRYIELGRTRLKKGVGRDDKASKSY